MEIKWYTAVILGLLVAMFFALTFGAKRAKWNARRLANAAMCIAIAFVLSLIKIWEMPQGGTITPASMLPLVLFCLAAGPWQGIAMGCAYGMLQLLDNPYVIHPVQLLVDYPLAFGAVALACVAAKIPVRDSVKLPIAVLLGFVGRYIMAVISGTVFFAEHAGDQNALIYSLGYNIAYLGPDCIVCMLVACVPGMSRLWKSMK